MQNQMMYSREPDDNCCCLIFRTSLYVHQNTFGVLFYQNTFKFQQNSIKNMTCCHGNPKTLKTYGIPSKRPLTYERMLNHAKNNVCSITYTLNMSQHTFCLCLFAQHTPKLLRNKRHDVTYLHDVNNVIYRNGTTCIILKLVTL